MLHKKKTFSLNPRKKLVFCYEPLQNKKRITTCRKQEVTLQCTACSSCQLIILRHLKALLIIVHGSKMQKQTGQF